MLDGDGEGLMRVTNELDMYVLEEAVRLQPGEECIIRIQQPPDGSPRRVFINDREAKLDQSLVGGQRWGG